MTRESDDAPHILLVEDNPGDVRLIAEALEDSDSTLSTVTDGERALARLSRDGKPDPDAVLLDLNLPKVDGTSVLEELRADQNLSSIPVLVLTSSSAADDVERTDELGADGYFVKPVDPEEFFALVRRVDESLVEDGGVPPGEFATDAAAGRQ